MWNKLLIPVIAIVAFSFLVVFMQRVDIIYFRHPTCRFVEGLDNVMSELKAEFGDEVNIRIINVKMEASDPEDSAEVKSLRETYNVVGVPVVVINGKEFTDEFTKSNLKRSVCDELLLKPEVCI